MEQKKMSDSVDSESKSLFFAQKNELLSVFDSTRFGPHFWSRDVCVRVYLYAVLYLDQETSSESKHMFSHLLDGYHEFIFFNHILEFFMANCVDLLCRIKSFCNKYKRMCFLTLDFVFG